MKPRLVLSVSRAQLLAEVVGPATRSGGIAAVLRGFLPARESPHEVIARVVLSGAIARELPAKLDQALLEVGALYGRSLAGFDLEVRLGMAYARIGLMALGDVAATELAFSTR